jgi:predicted translin family RNA/ssDNA-binding protein
MEALSFQHYLENQTLVSYDEAKSKVGALSGEDVDVLLTPEDYILGIFDMIGELMRFSITSMATTGKLPTGKSNKEKPVKQETSEDSMDIDGQTVVPTEEQPPRNVLSDLREIRLQLEMFEPPSGGKFLSEVEKKMTVMRECVDKVEKALYSLTVRGSERPKGWLPDDRRAEVESY